MTKFRQRKMGLIIFIAYAISHFDANLDKKKWNVYLKDNFKGPTF